MTNDNKKPQDIGALWVKQGPKTEYMSGTLEVEGKKITVICFRNSFKKADKHPDWRIYPSTPKPKNITA